jgi:hypothetical protein
LTAKVYVFPSPAVIMAVRHLEGRGGPVEADALACSIVLNAIELGQPVPPWAVTVVLSTFYRYVKDPFGIVLANALADVDHPEVKAVLGRVHHWLPRSKDQLSLYCSIHPGGADDTGYP